jgi:geranylgeranyl diphosphate synthase type II
MGALIGGASTIDQQNIYAFGKNLGLAFQVQDDFLDTFGNPEKFGKQKGGDILSNKKTFLLVNALENADAAEKKIIGQLLTYSGADKIERMTEIFLNAGVDLRAQAAKRNYLEKAYHHLDDIMVPSENKTALKELAEYLLERES